MKTNGLLPLFLSQALRSAGVSLLSFFSVVFIFKRSLALTADLQLAIIFVFGFDLVLYIFKFIANCWAENLSQSFGLKRQVYFGQILTALTLLAFLLSDRYFGFIWVAAIFWGLAIGFFWFGRHGLVAKISCSGRYGRALGWGDILETILLSAAPFLGGVLISHFGYPALFLASLAFVILGFGALTPAEEKKTHQDVTLREIFKLFLNHKKMFLTYLSQGAIEVFYGTAFILYVFLIIRQELVFGSFFSLSMLSVVLVGFLVGAWTDKKGKAGLIAFGTFFSACLWVGRLMTRVIGALLFFDILERFLEKTVIMPLEVLSYEKAIDGQSTGRAILFREIAITSGSILSCFFLIALILLGGELRWSFLVAAIISLLPLLIIKKV